MKITFKSKKLEKMMTSKLQMRHGEPVKKAVDRRFQELEHAENLAILGKIAGAGLHPLTGDRKGQFAVRVSKGKRMVFSPVNARFKEDGGLDLERVTEIVIEEDIVNYHD